MAHFDQINNVQILFHQQYYDEKGKQQERAFLLEENGQLNRLSWDKTSDIKGAMLLKTRKLHRGDLFTVYEGLAHHFKKQVFEPVRRDMEGSYFEVFFFKDGKSVYQDPITKDPISLIRSEGNTLFLKGHDIAELLFGPKRSNEERPLGAEFLEAYFDIAIPYGFEATALSEIHLAVTSGDDPKLYEEGEAFIRWLIHGEGLPQISDDLRDFIQQNADIFRNHMLEIDIRTNRETAMVRGAYFLWKIGENEEAYNYLLPLADQEKSALACYQIALWYCQDDKLSSAFKYASMGSSLGNGDASFIAANMCADRGLQDLARMYIDQGIESGNGNCFYFMAKQIMRFGKEKGDHSFKFDNPVSAAIHFADVGVQKHSSKAMVFLARLLIDFMGVDGANVGLQMLLRAEEVGEKEALYRLALYYKNDHGEAGKKDLFLAESYVKRAIIEDAYNQDDLQLLYADILLDEGESNKAFRFVEELARKGNEKAQVFLGKLISGADPRDPFAMNPIPASLIGTIKEEKTFFKAVLWRTYPDICTAKEASSILGKLAKKGEALAFYELALIHREGPDEMRDEKKAAYFEECFEKYRPK
ncbi:MAG: hypothetical protein SPL80_10160 [Bacilli bacterium]|nr:hypothetical protein [Bacilli bacterium]